MFNGLVNALVLHVLILVGPEVPLFMFPQQLSERRIEKRSVAVRLAFVATVASVTMALVVIYLGPPVLGYFGITQAVGVPLIGIAVCLHAGLKPFGINLVTILRAVTKLAGLLLSLVTKAQLVKLLLAMQAEAQKANAPSTWVGLLLAVVQAEASTTQASATQAPTAHATRARAFARSIGRMLSWCARVLGIRTLASDLGIVYFPYVVPLVIGGAYTSWALRLAIARPILVEAVLLSMGICLILMLLGIELRRSAIKMSPKADRAIEILVGIIFLGFALGLISNMA
jgi:hypothetical protein